MVDVLLVLLLTVAFLVGFFQGTVRGLLGIAAWLVAFIVGANVSRPVGDWLAGQWRNYSPAYNDMLAFGAIALVIFLVAEVAIHVAASGTAAVTRYALLEDILAGLLGIALALLVLAATVVVLASFYDSAAVAGAAQDASWSADLHRILGDSAMGRFVRDSLVPGLGAILQLVLPREILDVMR